MDTLILGNTLKEWLIGLSLAGALLVAVYVTLKVVTRKLAVFAAKTHTQYDDLAAEALRHTKFLFLVVLSIFAGSMALTLPPHASELLRTAVILALLLQGATWGNVVLTSWLKKTIAARVDQDAARATTLGALGFIGKLALWTTAVLLILDNVGISITGLVAGLGIGGIAVALALQNVLGDLFASLSIVLDRPFVIGDFILVDEHVGTVEHIGLKTTRLRSLSGEQIVCSNSDLLKSRIRNYKRMYERRILFTLGITYGTPHEKLAGIGGMIRTIVESQPKTRFDRAHFKEFGDSALQFEVVYFVTTPDYNTYMDIQQAINLEISRRFFAEGIEFAFPTRTVFVRHEDCEGTPHRG